jgi:hypothetical protein
MPANLKVATNSIPTLSIRAIGKVHHYRMPAGSEIHSAVPAGCPRHQRMASDNPSSRVKRGRHSVSSRSR